MRQSPFLNLLIMIFALVGLGAIAGVAVLIHGGITTRETPTPTERALARAARHLAIPANARAMTNPIALNDGVLAEARAHWADHCAMCHANDGSGQCEIGQHLYPQPPDMRLDETQKLSDGELFFIIKNGVRLTGMPAWGDSTADDAGSWKLVHFIRHLPKITPDELKQMKGMNPVSPLEAQEKKEEDEFLEGK